MEGKDTKWVWGTVGVLGGLAVIGGMLPEPPPPPPDYSRPSSDGRMKAKRVTIACSDKPFMERYLSAIRDRDDEAVWVGVFTAALADDCVNLDAGDIVYVLDYSYDSDVLMEIRQPGLLVGYYAIKAFFTSDGLD